MIIELDKSESLEKIYCTLCCDSKGIKSELKWNGTISIDNPKQFTYSCNCGHSVNSNIEYPKKLNKQRK